MQVYYDGGVVLFWQLTFVCFQSFGDYILRNSSAYLHPKPEHFPASVKWPDAYQIVDSLAQMARLHWP